MTDNKEYKETNFIEGVDDREFMEGLLSDKGMCPLNNSAHFHKAVRFIDHLWVNGCSEKRSWIPNVLKYIIEGGILGKSDIKELIASIARNRFNHLMSIKDFISVRQLHEWIDMGEAINIFEHGSGGCSMGIRFLSQEILSDKHFQLKILQANKGYRSPLFEVSSVDYTDDWDVLQAATKEGEDIKTVRSRLKKIREICYPHWVTFLRDVEYLPVVKEGSPFFYNLDKPTMQAMSEPEDLRTITFCFSGGGVQSQKFSIDIEGVEFNDR